MGTGKLTAADTNRLTGHASPGFRTHLTSIAESMLGSNYKRCCIVELGGFLLYVDGAFKCL